MCYSWHHMEHSPDRPALFSGVVLLLMAAIVGAASLLWQSFIDFTPTGDGLVGVQDGLSDSPAFIPNQGSSEGELVFAFDIPRGEVVSFLETVRPTLASLAIALHRTARIDFAENHLDILGRVARGQAHIGAISALVFARERKQQAIQPLLERSGDIPKTSLFVVRQGDSFQSLADLRGTRIAFKDLQSLSGNFIPRRELRRLGFSDPGFFRQESFTGNLSNSLIGLLNGEFDCIVLSNLFFNEQPEQTRSQLRIIHSSAPLPGGVYFGRTDLPASFVAQFQENFLKLSTAPQDGFAGYFRVRIPEQEMFEALEAQGEE